MSLFGRIKGMLFFFLLLFFTTSIFLEIELFKKKIFPTYDLATLLLILFKLILKWQYCADKYIHFPAVGHIF